MAEITCACGQTFASHYMLGEPRTHCPYCRRELPRETSPAPLLAELAEPVKLAQAVGPTSVPQVTTPATLVELIRRKDELRRETAAAAPARPWHMEREAWREAAVVPAPVPAGADTVALPDSGDRRFLDPTATTAALGEVRQLLEQHLAKKRRQACEGCELATCEQAFSCGALPRERHGFVYVLGWTLLPLLLAFMATAILVLPIWYVATFERERHYGLLAMGLASIPLLIGLTTFFYTYFASRWRRAHWRALAVAAKELELRFGLVKIPSQAASAAIPVLCPGASATARPLASDELDVRIVLSGKRADHEVLVVQHEFRFAVADNLSPGAVRRAPLLLRLPLLFAHQWKQPLWRGYLLALFPGELAGVPDFAIGSAEDPEAAFLKNHYHGQAAAIPSLRGDQPVVFAAADAAAPPLPHALHELLGTLEPGWSIQVSAGRLIVWREAYWPGAFWTLPTSGPAVVELVQVAGRIRQILSGC